MIPFSTLFFEYIVGQNWLKKNPFVFIVPPPINVGRNKKNKSGNKTDPW